jgi:hypothetical protein
MGGGFKVVCTTCKIMIHEITRSFVYVRGSVFLKIQNHAVGTIEKWKMENDEWKMIFRPVSIMKTSQTAAFI